MTDQEGEQPDYDPTDFNSRERRLFAGFMALLIALAAALERLPPEAHESVRHQLLNNGLQLYSVFQEAGRGRALRNEFGKALDNLAGWIERGARIDDLSWIIPLGD